MFGCVDIESGHKQTTMFKSKKADKSAPTTADPIMDHWTDGKENNRPRGGSVTTGVAQKPAPWVTPVQAPIGDSPGSRSRTQSSSSDRREQAAKIIETHAMNRAFERMLDELQIPSTLRPKLSTLDTPVKAAMLKSSHILNIDDPLAPPRKIPATLRKSRSSTSLDTTRGSHTRTQSMFPDYPSEGEQRTPTRSTSSTRLTLDDPFEPVVSPWLHADPSASALSLPRSASSYGSFSGASGLSTSDNKLSGKPKTSKIKGDDKDLSPAKFCNMLKSTKSVDLQVEKVKKLRLMLRNESAGYAYALSS